MKCTYLCTTCCFKCHLIRVRSFYQDHEEFYREGDCDTSTKIECRKNICFLMLLCSLWNFKSNYVFSRNKFLTNYNLSLRKVRKNRSWYDFLNKLKSSLFAKIKTLAIALILSTDNDWQENSNYLLVITVINLFFLSVIHFVIIIVL